MTRLRTSKTQSKARELKAETPAVGSSLASDEQMQSRQGTQMLGAKIRDRRAWCIKG